MVSERTTISVFELKTFEMKKCTWSTVQATADLQKETTTISDYEILVASNGFAHGFPDSAGTAHAMACIGGAGGSSERQMELETMLYDMFNHSIYSNIYDYILFLDQRSSPVKSLQGITESRCKSAFSRTLEEVEKDGRGKIGVVGTPKVPARASPWLPHRTHCSRH